MKLEVGMYVRFKTLSNEVKISQIKEIENKIYILDNEEATTDKFIIGKPSFNIIDLIEEEDYANGVKVKYIYEKGEKYGFNSNYVVQEKSIELDGSYEYDTIPSDFLLKNKDIKSVVTKEQMEQMEYKVEE